MKALPEIRLRRAPHTRAGNWLSANSEWSFDRVVNDDRSRRGWMVRAVYQNESGLAREQLLQSANLHRQWFPTRREAMLALECALHQAGFQPNQPVPNPWSLR